MPKTVVTIVRHGETDHNAAKIVQGHVDTPLNSEGFAQARVVAKYLWSTVAFDTAWASDLRRASKTAEIILAEQTCPLRIDPRLRERFLGDLQGRKTGEGDRSTIEPLDVLHARLFEFWDDLFPAEVPEPSAETPPRTTDRQILLVSHGGAIRALVQGLLSERAGDYSSDLPGESAGTGGRIGNCSVTQFVMERNGGGRWKGELVRYGDESHFLDSSRVPSPSGVNADVVD